jgi:hypothetical protein
MPLTLDDFIKKTTILVEEKEVYEEEDVCDEEDAN